jgi:hypothetical protein
MRGVSGLTSQAWCVRLKAVNALQPRHGKTELCVLPPNISCSRADCSARDLCTALTSSAECNHALHMLDVIKL